MSQKIKVGSLVMTKQALPLLGIVVVADDALWQSDRVSSVLITTAGEYMGNTYEFRKHQLEIISEAH